jgi:DNA-binding NarL/FixJ family response regulator
MSRSLIAVVEDHQLLAETLAAALHSRDIDTVLCPPTEPGSVLAALREHRPDLVLLDLDLGAFGSSVELIAPLSADGTRVLLVTGSTDRLAIATALEQGAIGWQSKADGFGALVDTAKLALGCTSVLDPAGREQLLAELAVERAARAEIDAAYEQLTVRERHTLEALGDGRSVGEIAAGWVVSEATVRSHVRGLLVKLGVASQLAAVSTARRNSWLRPIQPRSPR